MTYAHTTRKYMKTYYKFFSLKGDKKQHAIDAICESQLYMSPYLSQRGVNDTEEGIYYLDTSIEQYLRDKVKADKKLFLICSTAAHCRNPHLWKAFANRNMGICLAFEPKVNPEIEKSKIRYIDTHPYLSENIYRALPSAVIAKFVLSHKLTKFQKEDEVRFFKKVDNISSDFMPINIKYIRLGRSISQKDERQIRELAKTYSIKIIKQR